MLPNGKGDPEVQRLLHNLGILPAVLSVLTLPWESEVLYKCNTNTGALFRCCNKLLQVSVSGNDVNQRSVFEELDTVLELVGQGVGAETTVAFIFKENLSLCMSIPQGILYKFVRLLLDIGPNCEFLGLLEVVCCFEGHPILDNQLEVIRVLTSDAHSGVLHMYAKPRGTDEYERRVELMTVYDACMKSKESDQSIRSLDIENSEDATVGYISQEQESDVQLLLYHVKVLQVLERCCMGRNGIAEAVTEALYPESLILDALLDLRTNYVVRTELLRLYREVYLDRERPQFEAVTGCCVWDLLARVTTDVKLLSEACVGRESESGNCLRLDVHDIRAPGVPNSVDSNERPYCESEFKESIHHAGPSSAFVESNNSDGLFQSGSEMGKKRSGKELLGI